MSSIISIKALLDSKDVTRGVGTMNKELGKVDKKTKGVSGAFKGLAVAGGLLAAGSFLKGAISEASEAAKVGKETERVWKGLGKQAEINAKQVDKLSAAIGVDDEELQKQANRLVTSNKLMAENGNATRTVALAHDLAAAGIGNAEGNSAKLAKALSGSSKNMAGLKKLIPGLTNEQLKHAQSLKDQGKEQESINYLMGIGEKKVKGSAAAQAPALQKLQVAFGNIVESIGTLLLPIVEKLANFATTTLVPILEKVIGFLGRNSDVIVPLVGFIATLVAAIKVWTIVQTALNVVMSLNPLGIIIIAIVAVVAAIFIAYKKFQGFRDVVQKVWAGIKVAFEVGKKVIGVVFTIIGAYIKAWLAVAKFVFNAVGTVLSTFWNAVKTAFDKVKGFITSMSSKFSGIITTVTDAFKNAPTLLFNAGKDIVTGLWNGIKSLGSFLKDKVTSFINEHVPGPVKKLLGINSPSRVFKGFGKNVAKGLAIGLEQTKEVRAATLNLAKTVSGNFEPTLSMNTSGVALAGASGSSITYNITVNSLDTSADVGRRVVTAIKDYERVSGNGWRG